ncbi:MAG: Trk system potassium transporter TrkA [Oscillospiraceae bacterium]|nr:Trk system potassium transporter TrkA [Oscillospiraceae bacterium]
MNIIIAGAHAIGTHLAQLLTRLNHEIKLVDEDEEVISNISTDYDMLTYCGSPSSIQTLKDLEVDDCDLFIAVTLDENMNMNACYLAKAMGAKRCVAKVNSFEYTSPECKDMFLQLGIDSIIYPEFLAAKQIAEGLKMSWVRQRVYFEGSDLVMLGIKMREEAEILDVPLKDLCNADTPYHIVAIKRAGETIIPGGFDELHIYDLVYFMTTKQYIPYIRRIVGKEHYVDVKNVMVMGGGDTGLRAVQEMPSYLQIRLLEKDEKRCEVLTQHIDEKKVMIINADGRDINALQEESLASMHAFVACTGNAETNILACLTAKKFGVRKTVAVVENMDYADMAVSLDIGTIVNKKAIAASNIYQLMLNNSEMSNLQYLMTVNADVAVFIAKDGAKVTKKRVMDLGVPKGCTIGGLVRDGKGMLVFGNTQILPGDKVIILCHNIRVEKVETLFK